MSEPLEPRPYSERELTLKAISVTFLRANDAQQRLTARPTLDADPDTDADRDTTVDPSAYPDENDPEPIDPVATESVARPDPEAGSAPDLDPQPEPEPDSDLHADPSPESVPIDPLEAEDPGAIELAARQGEEQEHQALPNPIVTDANLRHYMDLAGGNQGNPDRVATSRLWRRVFGDRHPAQLSYNGAILHALHQLDHRTRLQQRTITRLEAELAETRRALAALQTDGMRSS